jgi:MoaA/NifB/PqqE/SkfB family radical SAM enzyme
MDEARSIGCRRLQFIGGEPTVHPDLLRLIEHAKHTGFKYIEVFTNATLLSEDLIESFKKLDVRVALSLYSSDPETHDQITGRAGSFDKTLTAIKQLVEQKIRFRTGIILMEQNATHFKKTKKFLKRLGAIYVGKDDMRRIGRGKQSVSEASPMDELCGHCWRGTLCIDPNGNAYPCVFSRFAPVGNFLTDGIKNIVEGQRLLAFRRVSYLGE